MKRPLILCVAMGFLVAAQVPRDRRPGEAEPGVRLPSGRMQQEEILKAEHEKNVDDVAQILRLAEKLQEELLKNDRHVLSLASIKKTEEIEKLAKRVRTRLKR